MTTKIYAVLVNWNGVSDTLACVKSLQRAVRRGFTLDIVVVDNGSTDNSPETLRKNYSGDNKVHLILSRKNNGFTGGNNKGISYALKREADFVLVINNDTEVHQDLVINLFEAFKDNSSVGITSPKIYFSPGFEYHKKYKTSHIGKIIWYAGGILDWNNVYGQNRGVDEVDQGQFNQVEEIDFATGACMMIDSRLLKKIGYFNEKYFAYLEDVEFSWRTKLAGWKIIYVPSACLWHKVSQSSGIGSNLNDYFITRNRLLFGMKYAKLRTRLALIREAIRFVVNGRKWQKTAVIDFMTGNLGKGSFE